MVSKQVADNQMACYEMEKVRHDVQAIGVTKSAPFDSLYELQAQPVEILGYQTMLG